MRLGLLTNQLLNAIISLFSFENSSPAHTELLLFHTYSIKSQFMKCTILILLFLFMPASAFIKADRMEMIFIAFDGHTSLTIPAVQC